MSSPKQAARRYAEEHVFRRHDPDATDIGHGAVPFAQILSYGSNGSPTITITKTLYQAGEVTSTTSGVSQNTDLTTTSTTTGTSTISNVHTVTRTSSSTTASSLPTSNTSLVSTGTASAKGDNAASGLDTESPPPPASGRVAGAIVGSFAAVGMIGILLWYFLGKRNGRVKLTARFKMRRRKSSDIKTPQIEGQNLEQTRTILLQQASLNKSHDRDITSFPTTSIDSTSDGHTSRLRSPVEASSGKPQWVGLAMTSSMPPDTPTSSRSLSQTGLRAVQSIGTTLSTDRSIELVPAPLRPGKPAPILTSHPSNKTQSMSPRSPRAILNVVSSTTTSAWRRASQVLSPSSYQRLDEEGPTRREGSRSERKTRNADLNIGPQTDGDGNEHWI